ncbi:LOW QUALITY PROTEIN: SOCS2 isoform 7, partial [Pongo abelii]
YVQMCKDKRTGPEAPRNGTVHLYLTKPLYTSAPSLQHLCRLTINKCTGAIWGLPLPTRLKDYLEEYKFQVQAPVGEKELLIGILKKWGTKLTQASLQFDMPADQSLLGILYFAF